MQPWAANCVADSAKDDIHSLPRWPPGGAIFCAPSLTPTRCQSLLVGAGCGVAHGLAPGAKQALLAEARLFGVARCATLLVVYAPPTDFAQLGTRQIR
jgi:hypothetical protein